MNGSFGPLTLAHQRDHRLSCLFGWPMSGVLLVVKSWWSNCWTIKLSASGPFVWSQLDWPFCRPFYVLMPVVHLVVSSWWFSWWPICYTLRSWSWQAIWWAKFSCPFGGPKLVVNSVDSQVIKWMGHLVCQSWQSLWWSKVGGPFGSPSEHQVGGPFFPKLLFFWWSEDGGPCGIPKLVVIWSIKTTTTLGPPKGPSTLVNQMANQIHDPWPTKVPLIEPPSLNHKRDHQLLHIKWPTKMVHQLWTTTGKCDIGTPNGPRTFITIFIYVNNDRDKGHRT